MLSVTLPGEIGGGPAMDAQNAWQAFARTGNILSYLDYKQQAGDAAHQEDEGHGANRNAGAGAPGGQI